MLSHLTARGQASATTIVALTAQTLEDWLKTQPAARKTWIRSVAFTAKPGSHCLIPDEEGKLAAVLVGTDEAAGPWSTAGLATALPALSGHQRLPDPSAVAAKPSSSFTSVQSRSKSRSLVNSCHD